MTAAVVEAGEGSGRIVSNLEAGPRGPEMAPDHTRAIDLLGCGERIYKIGAVKPSSRKVAPRGPYVAVGNLQIAPVTARTLEMTGLRRKSRTLLRLEKLEYNIPLQDAEFVQARRRE